MLRYGHGAGGVHLTHFTANITGKEQRKLCKERMAKQREDAKRNVNNGLGFTDARTIRFRNKIKNLQASIQQIKKNNRKKRSLKNEEKIKQKELQIKKLKEQLKEVLNNAVKKISYHKKTDKKGNIIEEITDEYGYKRIKKNGHVVKIEKVMNASKQTSKKTGKKKCSISSNAQNNQTKKGLTSSKEHKNSTGDNINSSLKREYENKISVKNSSQKPSSNNSSTRGKQKTICKDCVFMELITFQCKVFRNSCMGKKCGKYKKSRGLYGIVQ
ncbi:hypothetical protein [Selenomonas sp. KH1T6]|uniref:hypothetical protein n=1 Tax=Selenomonas sp. KH1T6 TaxID=3158784 RepID=UPI0008A7E17D|nr:hypothetical protein SAMN05216583_1172 [Selenomonas ruminantium]